MKFIVVVVFIVIYLVVGGYLVFVVQYSIFNDKLNVNILIEDFWDSLFKGKKN